MMATVLHEHPASEVYTRLEANADVLAKLRLFALLAPHLEVGGRGNNGNGAGTSSRSGSDNLHHRRSLPGDRGNRWAELAVAQEGRA
jgi:hypothetical protein